MQEAKCHTFYKRRYKIFAKLAKISVKNYPQQQKTPLLNLISQMTQTSSGVAKAQRHTQTDIYSPTAGPMPIKRRQKGLYNQSET